MVSAAQNDTAGWAGDRGRAHTWTQFDALPVGVKRIFWAAPYDYTARGAYRAMMAGADLKAKAALIVASYRRDVAREVRRIYGPEHPQARV